MNTNRRLELLTNFKQAGDRGLTMTEGQFNSTDVMHLDGLIYRNPGSLGVYCINEDGLNYLALRQQTARDAIAQAA